ncbi:MAG: aldolase/citrate lyase family protein [Elusimicrobiaceae bacterium]|nr:aldolase/citrate lyase family protein [Elusimicrobiota bacterium]
MNCLEKKMVDILADLKQNHHVEGVKAEFEAEGTRLEEAMRLKEVVTTAGLELTIKVGGCEALKDMYDAKIIGVSRIVGPMIETPYALQKFVNSAKLAFPKEYGDNVKFLVNIETETGHKNLEAMLNSDAIKGIHGVVLGRVDMCGSLALTREDINSDKIFDIAKDILVKSKERGLECCIGGGVSAHSLPFFKNLPPNTLDRFETRKIIFGAKAALADEKAPQGILKAVGFELLWLKNKRDFYGCIHKEDAKRIDMLEARYKKLIEEAGGQTGY